MPSGIRSCLRWFAAAALFAATLAPPPGAQAAQIQIESPSFTFDSEKKVYRYQEAKVRFRDITLEALDVEVFAETSEVKAHGQVRIREKSLFVSADRADFNADTGTGIIENARVYDSKSGYYFTAKSLQRTEKGTFIGDECELTACPPFVPGWTISAGEITYDVNNFATGSNARLELGDIPVFWFPFLAWPTVDRRTSGFLQPTYSQWQSTLPRYDLGSRLQVPYFWALGPDHDLTITPEWIDRRGDAYEFDYRYAFRRNQTGALRLWGIQEQFSRNPGEENDILPAGEAAERTRFPTRYILEWTHNQQIGNTGRAVLSLVNSSDGQVWREYEREENYRPDFSYQASFTNQAAWGDVGLTTEHASEYLNESIYANSSSFADGDDRPALLPRLTYFGSLQPSARWPAVFQLSSFTTHFVTKNELSGQATLIRPEVVLPVSFGPGLELRTTLGRTFVDYSGLYRDRSDVTVPEGSPGFAQSLLLLELRADLSRVYPQNNPRLLSLKHTVSPRLILDAVQDTVQPLADRVVKSEVAREVLTVRLDNTWLGQPRPADPQLLEDKRPFTTDPPAANALDPKVPRPRTIQPPVAEVATLNLIQRYNILKEGPNYAPAGPVIASQQETDPGQPLLPLIVEGTVHLSGVNVGSELHYHHQLRRITESRISMQGTAKAYSSLGITYSQNEFAYRTPEDVLRPEGTTFSFNGEVPVADQFSIGFSGTMNLVTEAAPLGRRLQKGLVFADFHPICYRIRLSYEEKLELTQQDGLDQYFVNRRVSLTFDLGSLFTGTQQRTVASGGNP